MDKFLKKRPRVSIGSSSVNVEQEPQQLENYVVVEINPYEIEIDKEKIKADPGLRDPIDSFDVNIHYRIRREYVAKAPGDEAFVSGGFSNWKKANEKFRAHSVTYIVSRVGSKQDKEYRTRLTATLDVIRFLLNQGLAFRGHDETSTSSNRRNFLELLYWYSLRNEEVGQVVLKNAPRNKQMIAPSIQKEMVNVCAVETTLEIMKELGDGLFSIMVDESQDCSVKEKMAIVIRYVNKNGEIMEKNLASVHVKETSSRCLKMAIDFIFSKLELSLSRLRGQGYDGALNMRGEFNGLKALILKENPSAWVDKLRQIEYERMVERIEKGEITSVTVLETVFEDWVDQETSGKSKGLLQKMENFDFVFLMMFDETFVGYD
ncbi:zinc finger MYM-type protein 1-like [Salvia splendens]|uniref:zinc finger MYM-type protein 1-like n=1 Tax=Salvia splendens TaxID=180675 RepID=UPI001C26EA9D|nr:zinc finger MYM-type protein 1-like [Salvia splendens]